MFSHAQLYHVVLLHTNYTTPIHLLNTNTHLHFDYPHLYVYIPPALHLSSHLHLHYTDHLPLPYPPTILLLTLPCTYPPPWTCMSTYIYKHQLQHLPLSPALPHIILIDPPYTYMQTLHRSLYPALLTLHSLIDTYPHAKPKPQNLHLSMHHLLSCTSTCKVGWGKSKVRWGMEW